MRSKQGGRRGGARKPGGGGRGSQGTPGGRVGGYCSDPFLVPRIQDYAQNNDYTDVDQVVEYLRCAYHRQLSRHGSSLVSEPHIPRVAGTIIASTSASKSCR